MQAYRVFARLPATILKHLEVAVSCVGDGGVCLRRVKAKEGRVQINDKHKDVLTVVSVGDLIEDAIEAGIAEVTEPGGPHDRFLFSSFEVVRIWGGIDQKAGKPGEPKVEAKRLATNVEMRFYGSHKEADAPA